MYSGVLWCTLVYSGVLWCTLVYSGSSPLKSAALDLTDLKMDLDLGWVFLRTYFDKYICIYSLNIILIDPCYPGMAFIEGVMRRGIEGGQSIFQNIYLPVCMSVPSHEIPFQFCFDPPPSPHPKCTKVCI